MMLATRSKSLKNGVVCVSFEGELDLHNAADLLAELERVTEEGDRGVVLDLSAVSSLDSTILGVLVVVQRRLERHGRHLFVIAPAPETRRPFETTGLDRTLRVYRSFGDALLDGGARG